MSLQSGLKTPCPGSLPLEMNKVKSMGLIPRPTMPCDSKGHISSGKQLVRRLNKQTKGGNIPV